MSTATDTERPALTLADRCDRCGAQAYVRAIMPGSAELLFCGHHGAKNLDALTAQAVHVDDYRHLINAKSESSA